MTGRDYPKGMEIIEDEDLDEAAGGKITFSDLIVSSYQTGGSAGAPREAFVPEVEKIEQNR